MKYSTQSAFFVFEIIYQENEKYDTDVENPANSFIVFSCLDNNLLKRKSWDLN
jgi:hypothetical protein